VLEGLTPTRDIKTTGMIAPEVMLNNLDTLPKICQKENSQDQVHDYSFAVDVFTSGILLLELIQENFYATIKKHTELHKKDFKTGNDRIDQIAPLTWFMTNLTEMSWTSDEFDQMLSPDDKSEMPWKEDASSDAGETKAAKLTRKYEEFVNNPDFNFPHANNHSSSYKFLRGFYMRHLKWDVDQKDQAADLIMKMINYFPKKRIPAEDILDLPIFSNLSEEKKMVQTYQPDTTKLNLPVNLSNEKSRKEFDRLLVANRFVASRPRGIYLDANDNHQTHEENVVIRLTPQNLREVFVLNEVDGGGYAPVIEVHRQIIDPEIENRRDLDLVDIFNHVVANIREEFSSQQNTNRPDDNESLTSEFIEYCQKQNQNQSP